jgi:hypothetical protein
MLLLLFFLGVTRSYPGMASDKVRLFADVTNRLQLYLPFTLLSLLEAGYDDSTSENVPGGYENYRFKVQRHEAGY